MSYYVIEREYVGPDLDQHLDDHEVTITREPARANMSGEVILTGWCGTSGDWTIHAHGEYPTLEAAQAAMHARWGTMRPYEEEYPEPDTERYRVYTYVPLNRGESEEWMLDGMRSEIGPETTDDELAALVASYEAEANDQGYELGDTLEIMREFREALR